MSRHYAKMATIAVCTWGVVSAWPHTAYGDDAKRGAEVLLAQAPRQLKSTRPTAKPIRPAQGLSPIPTTQSQSPGKALVIVVEENDSQSVSVSWKGLSDVYQNATVLDLLPTQPRNQIQQIADGLRQLVPSGGILPMDYIGQQVKKKLIKMLSDWVVLAGNQAGIPNTGCARGILNALGSTDPALGKDIFAVFKDRYGETGLGNCLKEMATPYYSKVQLLTDRGATTASLKRTLVNLHNQGYKIDLLLNAHGCGEPVSMNNMDNCNGNKHILFSGGDKLTINAIENMNGGATINLNSVYMVSCWGSNFNDAWLKLGAKGSNGARELNYYVLLSPLTFVDRYTRGRKSLKEASRLAYNAEKRLLNGGTYRVEISFKPFLDQVFPIQYTNPIPCPGFRVGNLTVGATLKKDYRGKKDYCVAEALGQRFEAEVSCKPAVETKIVQTGKDKCRPVDPVALLCPARTRESCKWAFDMGVRYGDIVNTMLGKKYGENKDRPVNNTASSQRVHADRAATATKAARR